MALIIGTIYSDGLYGESGADVLRGLGGDDFLNGDWGDDRLEGGHGNDRLYDMWGAGVYYGGAGADDLWSGDEDDLLYGGAGGDRLRSSGGNDQLFGEGGNDHLTSALGDDLVDGGLGIDTTELTYWGADAPVIFRYTGDGTYATAEGRKTLVGVERVLVVGSSHDDRMSGGSDNDSLNGSQGNDTLKGGAGNDTLTGEAGADSLYGEDGDDTFLDSSLHGGPANRLLDGGAGIDRAQIYLPDHTADIMFSIRNPARNANFGSTVVRNVEQVLLWAGSGDDHLTGGRLDDDLFSSAGDDTLLGLGGRDDLYSGEGDDILSGGGGNDRLVGDAGRDRLSGGSGNDDLEGGDDHDLLIGGAGGDRMDGGNGNDSYFVDSVSDEVVETGVGGGVDIVFASVSFTLGEGVEHLRLEGGEGLTGIGNAADNNIEGTIGADKLHGVGGRDRIIGHGGDDRLDGGSGNDQLRGGAGSDRFVFTEMLSAEDNVDALADFDVADDVILLWGRVFAGIGVGRLGSDAFHYGAEAADAEDRILYQQWTGRLFYDPDGSGRAEPILFARVEAGLELTAADFVVQW